MKIKVKLFEGGKMPQVNEKGDLFDVFSHEEVRLIAPQAGVQHQVNNEKVRDVTFIKLNFRVVSYSSPSYYLYYISSNDNIAIYKVP